MQGLSIVSNSNTHDTQSPMSFAQKIVRHQISIKKIKRIYNLFIKNCSSFIVQDVRMHTTLIPWITSNNKSRNESFKRKCTKNLKRKKLRCWSTNEHAWGE